MQGEMLPSGPAWPHHLFLSRKFFFEIQLCSWAQGEQFGPEGLGEEEEQ